MNEQEKREYLTSRMSKIDSLIARFDGPLDYEEKRYLAELSAEWQQLRDQLAETDGALPNDRPLQGNQS